MLRKMMSAILAVVWAASMFYSVAHASQGHHMDIIVNAVRSTATGVAPIEATFIITKDGVEVVRLSSGRHRFTIPETYVVTIVPPSG